MSDDHVPVTAYSPEEARDFFSRLAVYSAECVRVTLLDVHRHWPSKNHYNAWDRREGPLGCVLHYTAGTKFTGTIRHFVLERRASSHLVVGRGLDGRFAELRRQLELDRDLRAEVSLVVPPGKPAWHAGWVNRFLYGIEVRNAGVLRPHPRELGRPSALVQGISRDDFFRYGNRPVEELDFYWWPDGWTSKFSGEVVNVRGSWWETWSRGSVATVITLLRYLASLHPGRFRPEWLLCHHHVNRHKNDCVLLPDLGGIRDAVLHPRTHVDEIPWLAELDDADEAFEDAREPWVLQQGERQSDRAEEDLDDFDPELVEGSETRAWQAREGLRRLGYHVGTDETLLASIRIYQRSRGLTVDGVAGYRTLAVLDRELKSWRLT